MQHVFITGASSGFGAALAQSYSQPGCHITLCARNKVKLRDVASKCEALGSTCTIEVLDVSDTVACINVIDRAWARKPVDLCIAAAGIAVHDGSLVGGGEDDAVRLSRMIAINCSGTIATAVPMCVKMRQRGEGQVLLFSSLSGWYADPRKSGYCASKAFVGLYGRGLRSRMAPFGVKVSTLAPGYVKTPFTAKNNYSMPGLMELDDAVTLIREGLVRNVGTIAFPMSLSALLSVVSAIPPIHSWYSRRLADKAPRSALPNAKL